MTTIHFIKLADYNSCCTAVHYRLDQYFSRLKLNQLELLKPEGSGQIKCPPITGLIATLNIDRLLEPQGLTSFSTDERSLWCIRDALPDADGFGIAWVSRTLLLIVTPVLVSLEEVGFAHRFPA